MPRTRVIVTGIAVAAAAVAGSAFTATNTLEEDTVAGYGEVEVTGADVTNIAYTQNAADMELLDAVAFTASADMVNTAATMALTLNGTKLGAAPSTCAVDLVDTSLITCTMTTPIAFAAFDGVALTVVSE